MSTKKSIKFALKNRFLTITFDYLFSHLYIVTQHRDGDLSAFFQYENHPYPPSLSNRGKLRLGKKSELLNILLQESEAEKESPVSFDVKILDGAVIVHLLSPANATTFDDYANNVFIPYVKRQLDTSRRVDVVWDVYVASSIKESTREKRGKGIRRKVAGKNKIPKNWPDFLRDSANKNFFRFFPVK